MYICVSVCVDHKICHHCVADATELKVHTPFQDNSRKLTFSHSRSENQRNVEKRKVIWYQQQQKTRNCNGVIGFCTFSGCKKVSGSTRKFSFRLPDISPSLHLLDLLHSQVFHLRQELYTPPDFHFFTNNLLTKSDYNLLKNLEQFMPMYVYSCQVSYT